jgi:ABC-type nickel/cobalt efflux system permease component RcnA
VRRHILWLLLATAGVVTRVSGHQITGTDVATVTQLAVDYNSIKGTYEVQYGELAALEERRHIDGDGSGDITAAEIAAYTTRRAVELAANLSLNLDDRRLAVPLNGGEVLPPETLVAPGQMTVRYQLPPVSVDLTHAAVLGFRDANQFPRLVHADIVIDALPLVDIGAVEPRSGSVKTTKIQAPKGPVEARLTLEPAAAMWQGGAFAAGQQALGLGAPTAATATSQTASTTDRLKGMLRTEQLSLGVIVFALALSLFLGAAHALEPGHGKTIVAAYLIGSRGTVGNAVFLGGVVTFTHTFSVIILGALTLLASQYILPERIFPWLAASSGLLISGLGLWLLGRHLQGAGHGHAHGPFGHAHPHAPEPDSARLPQGRAALDDDEPACPHLHLPEAYTSAPPVARTARGAHGQHGGHGHDHPHADDEAHDSHSHHGEHGHDHHHADDEARGDHGHHGERGHDHHHADDVARGDHAHHGGHGHEHHHADRQAHGSHSDHGEHGHEHHHADDVAHDSHGHHGEHGHGNHHADDEARDSHSHHGGHGHEHRHADGKAHGSPGHQGGHGHEHHHADEAPTPGGAPSSPWSPGMHRHGPTGKPHAHVPQGQVTLGSLLALGISGGIVPCPGALVILLLAVALHRIAFGLLLIVTFSLGLAAVLIGIGVLMVKARPMVERFSGNGPWVRRLPAVSAALITVVGLVMAVKALIDAGIVIIRL